MELTPGTRVLCVGSHVAFSHDFFLLSDICYAIFLISSFLLHLHSHCKPILRRAQTSEGSRER